MAVKFLKFIFLSTLFFTASFAQAQNPEIVSKLQLLLEQVVLDNETSDTQQLLDELIPLLENPIPINTANEADVAQLFFLTPTQQANLIQHRELYGDYLSEYELAMVDGFNENLARLVATFFSFEEAPSKINRNNRLRHEALIRTTGLAQDQRGYLDRKYEGSKQRLYLRYRMSSNRLNVGLTAEKDPGEAFLAGSNAYGFDYLSGFVSYKLPSDNLQLIVGDYIVQWAQGLSIWQGFAMGKTSDVEQIARLNEGIKPYGSTNENNFMRGIAAKFSSNKFTAMPFVSYKQYDAKIDTTGGLRTFASLQDTGLHRTESEISNERSLLGLTIGTKLNYRHNNLRVGVSFLNQQFDAVMQASNQVYAQHFFKGNNLNNVSINYQYNFNKLFVFGESASSFSGLASLNGILYQPTGTVGISLLLRNIEKEYNALRATAFTESARVNDEHGLFAGIRISAIPNLTIRAYADFFQFNWVKYTTSAPGRGQEYQLQADYKIKPDWNVDARIFYEAKPKKLSEGEVGKDVLQQRLLNRIQLNGMLNNNISIRTRVELSEYVHKTYSFGYIVAQDVGYNNKSNWFKSWLRIAYFNIDDYNSRIYTYENDLLYQFSVPSFYGEGIRSYINLTAKIKHRWQCWLKLGHTVYLNRNTIGSGYSLIEGNKHTEMKLQLRYKI